jgi:hypothetical protein
MEADRPTDHATEWSIQRLEGEIGEGKLRQNKNFAQRFRTREINCKSPNQISDYTILGHLNYRAKDLSNSHAFLR